MELDRIALFINKLSEKTKIDGVVWQESASNSYSTLLGKYKVAISIHEAEDSPYVDPDYIIGFYRENEDAWVDSVSDDELKEVLPGSFKVLQGLYRGARRNARGLSEIVEDLIGELDDEL